MAAGMLTSVSLVVVSGVICGLAAILVGSSANTLVVIILLAILLLYWGSPFGTNVSR